MSSCSPLNWRVSRMWVSSIRRGPGVRLATPRAGHDPEDDSSGGLGSEKWSVLGLRSGGPEGRPLSGPLPLSPCRACVSSSSSCTFSVLIALICASICAMRSSAVTGGAPLPSPPVSIPCSAPVPPPAPANGRLVPGPKNRPGFLGFGGYVGARGRDRG